MHFINRLAARVDEPLGRIPYFAAVCVLYALMRICVLISLRLHPLSVEYFAGPAALFWNACAQSDPFIATCGGTVIAIICILTMRRMRTVGWPPVLAVLILIPFLGDLFLQWRRAHRNAM